jgi:sugar phosphate isomerase/epimerase
MQLGIFAKTFSEIGAEPVLKAIQQNGFSCTQFNMACMGLQSLPDEISPSDIAEISAAQKSSNIAITAISATYNMIHPDPARRAEGLKKLEVILQAAQSLNVSLVTLCTGSNDPLDQWKHHAENQCKHSWATLCEEMAKAIALADRYEINLGIEPELANVVNSAKAARRMLDDMKSKRLRIILDPVNLFEPHQTSQQHVIIAEAFALLHGDLAMAHIKDRNAEGQFVAAGKGGVDFPFFISQLKAAKFNGPLITHGLHANDAIQVSEYLKGILQ